MRAGCRRVGVFDLLPAAGVGPAQHLPLHLHAPQGQGAPASAMEGAAPHPPVPEWNPEGQQWCPQTHAKQVRPQYFACFEPFSLSDDRQIRRHLPAPVRSSLVKRICASLVGKFYLKSDGKARIGSALRLITESQYNTKTNRIEFVFWILFCQKKPRIRIGDSEIPGLEGELITELTHRLNL